jgi:hypothetical protein
MQEINTQAHMYNYTYFISFLMLNMLRFAHQHNAHTSCHPPTLIFQPSREEMVSLGYCTRYAQGNNFRSQCDRNALNITILLYTIPTPSGGYQDIFPSHTITPSL